MFRAEVRNIILSSIALQSLFNRSSNAHQTLIKRSSNAYQTLIERLSNAHQTLIFFRILYALPKSPRVILRALRGHASYCTSAHAYVRYILRQAPSGTTSRRPPLLLSKAHRLPAALPGTSRLRGGSGSGNRLGRTLRIASNAILICCEKS
jgi:hypothetical protein